MKKLSMMNKGFLFQESREMPMHVGSLNLYTLPDNADELEFLTRVTSPVSSHEFA